MNMLVLKLPRLPAEYADMLIKEGNLRENYSIPRSYEDQFNAWFPVPGDIQTWCEQNISPTVNWCVHINKCGSEPRTELDVVSKFNYILQSGGPSVELVFYDSDNIHETESIACVPGTWYMLNLQHMHGIRGLDDDTYRISLTARSW